jgi:hypothetical protein
VREKRVKLEYTRPVVFSEEDIHVFALEYLKTLRGETLDTDGHLLIVRNSVIGTFHLPRSDEDQQDNSNVRRRKSILCRRSLSRSH